LDIKAVIFDEKKSDTEKVEAIKRHYEQNDVVYAKYQAVSCQIRAENEEAVQRRQRLGLTNTDESLVSVVPEIFCRQPHNRQFQRLADRIPNERPSFLMELFNSTGTIWPKNNRRTRSHVNGTRVDQTTTRH
jgi:hypothetical protein